MRKKVAVFIDYTLRTPNFCAAYKSFKSELFSNKASEVSFDDKIRKEDVRLYWLTEMKNPEIEDFYIKVKEPKEDYAVRGKYQEYFFNEEHLNRFLEEYSYNLYVDCNVPDRNDLTILNTAQSQLFDVVLVDEITTKRKVSNTLFFLSKNVVYPQSILFLDKGQEINKENYIGVWNPKKDLTQINEPKNKAFLNWFMDLEKELKNNE